MLQCPRPYIHTKTSVHSQPMSSGCCCLGAKVAQNKDGHFVKAEWLLLAESKYSYIAVVVAGELVGSVV